MLPEPDARKSTVRWLRGLAMTSNCWKLRPSANESGSSKTITWPARGFALGGPRATSDSVFAAPSPPLRRIFAVSRRQQIENRCGAIGLTRPHRFFHILVAEDVALGVARIVSDEADGGPDLPLTSGDADLFHGSIINAHADKRGAQHFGNQVGTLVRELSVEILARAGMALEGFHVEPAHGRLLSMGYEGVAHGEHGAEVGLKVSAIS